MLIEHMRTFPTRLPASLVEGVSRETLFANGGDFSLKIIPAQDLPSYHMWCPKGYDADRVILFSSISVGFAYHPITGLEIANSMGTYKVTERTSLLPNWKRRLILDSLSFALRCINPKAQDAFIAKL